MSFPIAASARYVNAFLLRYYYYSWLCFKDEQYRPLTFTSEYRHNMLETDSGICFMYFIRKLFSYTHVENKITQGNVCNIILKTAFTDDVYKYHNR